MRILGLVSETHDSGLALLEDGEPRVILEEERHNREKHTLRFPSQSLEALFEHSTGGLANIDLITTPWDPKRLRRTFVNAVLRKFPASLALMLPAAHPAQDSGVAFLNFWMRQDLKRHFHGERLPPIVNVGHHESHAAIYFMSPFEEATIIVMDGYGDDAATSVFTANANCVERQWHGRFFDSLGMLYALITRHLGFEAFEEGTVMALAACGQDRLVKRMRDVVRLEPDGRFSINQNYFSFDCFGALRPFKRKFIEAFGPMRLPGEQLREHHMDLAYALQSLAEEVVLHVARAAIASYPSRNLCFTGGIALNCIANARLLQETDFKRVWVPPCASDTGTPLGSALWHYHKTLGMPRRREMTHAFYGMEYSADEMHTALRDAGLPYEHLEEGDLISRVAADLASDKIVGWYQGRYEIGPRALGNRSILASPRRSDIRDLINQRIKFRERFRPFAPSILQEHASEYFEMSQPSPFMTLAAKVRPGLASRIPAVVHTDATARVQTVHRETNPRYYALIGAFMNLTGVPVLLNTSFNKQEPIVTRPKDAISCFLRTDMDVLVLGNFYCTERPANAVQSARASFQSAYAK
jgi:carbamoyltransferase